MHPLFTRRKAFEIRSHHGTLLIHQRMFEQSNEVME